jgi:hypothetical protein
MKFLRVDRLDQVLVEPRLVSLPAVLFLPVPGQGDQLGSFELAPQPQGPGHFEAVPAGQGQVHDHDVRPVGDGRLEGSTAIGGHAHVVAP